MSSSKRNPTPPPEPVASIKRRKLGLSVTVQPSFVEVLEGFNDQTEREDSKTGPNATHIHTRPTILPPNSRIDRLVFQQIDITIDQDMKTLLMFGLTQEGHTILSHVTGFMPYFYVKAPCDFGPHDLNPLQVALNHQLESDVVIDADIVMKHELRNYRGDTKVPFIKITLQDQHSLEQIKDEYYPSPPCSRNRLTNDPSPLLETNKFTYRERQLGPTTYESDIPYILRFMTHTKLVGMSWVEVPPMAYTVRIKKASHCQLEFQMEWDAFIAHAPVGVWSRSAPLRILSFDIECAGRGSTFPKAQIDPVIQIATMVTHSGESRPFIRNVFSFKECEDITGAQVHCFDNELEMLMAWHEFVGEVDPDIIIGFNISHFDLPYLLDRAKALGGSRFSYLGRLKEIEVQVNNVDFFTKVKRHDVRETYIVGRLSLDLQRYIQNEHELPSYTLNSACAHFLREKKEEGVHWSLITQMWNDSAKSRRQVAIYCLKDAYLPQVLLNKLNCLVKYGEMARITGVPFNHLLFGGQSIRVFSLLYREANRTDYVIPAANSCTGYKGLAGIGPLKGYDDLPIIVESLPNPHIIMAHNLCYTTLLSREAAKRWGFVMDDDYIVTPNKTYFVTTAKRKGLLPMIVERLLLSLKRVEVKLEKEDDPTEHAVLHSQRHVLQKISRSVHGFTHATSGRLPCPQLSWSVIALSRQLAVEEKEVHR